MQRYTHFVFCIKGAKLSFSKDAWTHARTLYEAGKPASEITDTYGMSVSQISRRSRLENWERPNEYYPTPTVSHAFRKAAEVIKRAEVLEIENTEKESDVVFALRKKAREVQSELLDLVLEAKSAMQAFINAHPDGRYIKKDDEKGTAYGLVSEIFQPLASLLNASHAITQTQRPINLTTNTQINQNSDQPMPPTAPIIIEFNGK